MKSATGTTSMGLQACLETCRRCEHLAQVNEVGIVRSRKCLLAIEPSESKEIAVL